MATFRYFLDTAGIAEELTGIQHHGPGSRGRHFSGINGAGDRVRATRKVEIKRRSGGGHKCGSRCLNAGPNSPCECQCRGQNHGAGAFACVALEG